MTPEEQHQPIMWQHFCQKLHENEEIGPGLWGSLTPHVDPRLANLDLSVLDVADNFYHLKYFNSGTSGWVGVQVVWNQCDPLAVILSHEIGGS